MHVVAVLVCLALGVGLSAACSPPLTAIPSLITPTPSDVESLIGTRIIAENDAVLEATVQEKGKDIHVAVVISDNTGLAAAKILLHREAYSKNERNPNAAGKPEVSSMTGLPPCLEGGAILHIRHGISSS